MSLAKWKKIILGLAATVLLGAFGSGLWELGLRPVGQWLGKLVLTGATLGSAAVKDGIYREAAKGLHEASSIQIFFLIVFCALALCSAFVGYITGRRKASKSSIQLREKLGRLSGEDRRKPGDDEISTIEKKLYTIRLTAGGLALLFASIQFINYLKLLQANSAYTFFAQSMAICRPYIDEQQALLLESRFASIRGRNDYIGITNDLKHIATLNNRRLPDFAPW